jgi:hypothetical protein
VTARAISNHYVVEAHREGDRIRIFIPKIGRSFTVANLSQLEQRAKGAITDVHGIDVDDIVLTVRPTEPYPGPLFFDKSDAERLRGLRELAKARAEADRDMAAILGCGAVVVALVVVALIRKAVRR